MVRAVRADDRLLGPGLAADLTISGGPESTPIGPLFDNGDGTYSVDVSYDPNSGQPPGVALTQPGRPSTHLAEPTPQSPNDPEIPWWLWLLILILIVIILVLLIT